MPHKQLEDENWPELPLSGASEDICPSAEEVADMVGLGNNMKYFYRLFRQYSGMSLKEYRESVQR